MHETLRSETPLTVEVQTQSGKHFEHTLSHHEALRNMCGSRACSTRLYDVRCQGFFFPWPEQPYQVFDDNTERVALKRSLLEDDQWVVPHNLYLTVFSPSSVNVLCFDPQRGADQAMNKTQVG